MHNNVDVAMTPPTKAANPIRCVLHHVASRRINLIVRRIALPDLVMRGALTVARYPTTPKAAHSALSRKRCPAGFAGKPPELIDTGTLAVRVWPYRAAMKLPHLPDSRGSATTVRHSQCRREWSPRVNQALRSDRR